MPVSFNLKKLIHRKSPEFMAPLPGGNTAAGGFIVSDKADIIPDHETAFYVGGASAIYRYSSDEDSFIQVPNSGIAGTFAAGSCGEFRAMSAPGGVQNLTATAGTTTSIATSLTLAQNLKGRKVRILTGPNAGAELTIAYNTIGANAVITFTTTAGTAFSSANTFNIFAGSLWFFNAGTTAVGFSVYDIATNAWTARSVTGLPTAWGTDAQLIGTGSAISNNGLGFVNGTASAGAASTLTDGAKAWPVNGWANCQVRIKSGTGAGQVRAIASNTATVLTVGTAWTTAPDATSVYVIEGNDDYLYLLGNNAVTLYRYTISTNTWATLTPTAARAAAYGAGGTADWVDSTPEWQENQAGVYGAHYSSTIIRQNGRYIYSFRGGGSSALDVYDIAANTWVSSVAYGGQNETFNAGSSAVDIDGTIFLQKEASGRFFKFKVGEHKIEPFFVSPMPQGTAVAGDKMFIASYKEGTSVGRWLYSLSHTRSEMIRLFIV